MQRVLTGSRRHRCDDIRRGDERIRLKRTATAAQRAAQLAFGKSRRLTTDLRALIVLNKRIVRCCRREDAVVRTGFANASHRIHQTGSKVLSAQRIEKEVDREIRVE